MTQPLQLPERAILDTSVVIADDVAPLSGLLAISYGRLAAATAHAHQARLCTRNPADFAGLEDLVVIEVV